MTITELPLLSYAGLLRQLASDRSNRPNRLYDIGQSGLSLGLPRLQETAIEELLADYRPEPQRIFDAPAQRRASTEERSAVSRDYLQALADELAAAIELLESIDFHAGLREDAMAAEQQTYHQQPHYQKARRAYERLDWVRIDFPTQAPTLAGLERLLVSARDFRRRIQRLIVRAS